MVKPVNKGLTGSVFGRFTINRAAGLFSAEFENRYDDNNRPGEYLPGLFYFFVAKEAFSSLYSEDPGFF